MFKKNHVLKNCKQLEILRCSKDDEPYIKSLKNIMDEEVQSIYHMGTYKTTRMYYFKKLMAEPESDYAQIQISASLSTPNNRNIFLLAVIDNEIAGYVKASGIWKKEEDPARKNLSLWDIEVISKYRRLGVAYLLFEALKEYGAENGYENIYSASIRPSSRKSDDSAGINLFLKTGAIELNNINIMVALLFGVEDDCEELPDVDNLNMDGIRRVRSMVRETAYKWRIK